MRYNFDTIYLETGIVKSEKNLTFKRTLLRMTYGRFTIFMIYSVGKCNIKEFLLWLFWKFISRWFWISSAISAFSVIGLEMFFSIRKFSQLGCQVKVNTNKAILKFKSCITWFQFRVIFRLFHFSSNSNCHDYGFEVNVIYCVRCPFRQKNLNYSGHFEEIRNSWLSKWLK